MLIDIDNALKENNPNNLEIKDDDSLQKLSPTVTYVIHLIPPPISNPPV